MNKDIFRSAASKGKTPQADTINSAGGIAYSLSDKSALAQLVVTGCFNTTFYASAEVQLDKVLELTKAVSPKFIAQAAVYARESGYMKDSPAFLCAILAVRDVELLKAVFSRVIDNGKMLRNFVTIMRSGKVGRESFGTAVKKLIQKWFATRSDEQLFRDSVGEDGASLADCIKLCHPAPLTTEREALYAYIIGKKVVSRKKDMEKNEKTGRFNTVMITDLPECVQQYEIYKTLILAGKEAGPVPKVEFRLLTSLNLGKPEWTKIAKDANFHMARMNLNTFQRHGVFEDGKMVDLIASKLSDAETVAKIKVFPYQIFAAYKNIAAEVPAKIANALQDAAELATANIPQIDGKVYVFVDVSGSMHDPITGDRGTATTKVRCIDVAALMAASILRKNPDAEVIPFNVAVLPCKLNGRDSIVTNAERLSNLPQGGTACGAPVKMLNEKGATGDVCIMISDNESWADMAGSQINGHYYGNNLRPSLAVEWDKFKKRNPQAKMICVDLRPVTTTQVKDSKSVLNIGGFSDNVFEVVAQFAKGEMGGEHFVSVIEKVDVSSQSAIVEAAKAGAKKAKKR